MNGHAPDTLPKAGKASILAMVQAGVERRERTYADERGKKRKKAA